MFFFVHLAPRKNETETFMTSQIDLDLREAAMMKNKLDDDKEFNAYWDSLEGTDEEKLRKLKERKP